MISAKEAYDIYKNANPDHDVTYMSDCPDYYIIAFKHSDYQGYDIVNKMTGELGFIYWWQYFDQYNAGNVKWIKAEELIKGAS